MNLEDILNLADEKRLVGLRQAAPQAKKKKPRSYRFRFQELARPYYKCSLNGGLDSLNLI